MRDVTREDYEVIYRVLNAYYATVEGIMRDELISAGHLGLTRAAQRYDPDHPSAGAFMTFAWTYVHRAMQDAFRVEDHLFRRDRDAVNAQRKARDKNEDGRYDRPFVREDGSLIPGVPVTLEVVADVLSAPDAYAKVDRDDEIERALRGLCERDQVVVRCVDLGGWKLADVAAALGVTVSRVSQLRSRAHGRMRVLLDDSLSIEEAA